MASSKRRCCDQWIARTIHIFLTSMVLCIFFLKDTDLSRCLQDGRIWYLTTFLSLVVFAIIAYMLTSCMDPGFVQYSKNRESDIGLNFDNEDKDPLSLQITNLAEEADDTTEMSKMILPEGKALRLRICGYCEIKQPLRSKHCEDCGRCVRRYDHHCPWLGNCVGERNHRFFLIFLLLESCVIGWAIDISWMAMKTKPKASIWFKANWVFLGLMIFLIISLLVVGLLFLCHSYMMLTAQTTWEFMSRPRISYLKHFPEDENPFDLGYIKNMYGFLCYCKPRTWEKILKEKAGWA